MNAAKPRALRSNKCVVDIAGGNCGAQPVERGTGSRGGVLKIIERYDGDQGGEALPVQIQRSRRRVLTVHVLVPASELT